MFAHQVIEDLSVKSFMDDVYRDAIHGVMCAIKQSQKFHIGDVEQIPIKHANSFLPISNPMSDVQITHPPIMYENLTGLMLPYKICWIDYLMPKFTNCPKCGILAKNTQPNTIECYFLHFYSRSNVWQLLPYRCFVKIGDDFSKDGQEIEIDVLRKESLQHDFMLKRELSHSIKHLFTFLQIMSCKNIQTEKIPTPVKLNKKRREHGKQELFDYHVLNIVVPSQKYGYHESATPLSHNRVHLCRGHFKEYTTEHPLFGRFTGLYWWQPHVRGQNKKGIVMKDYSVETDHVKSIPFRSCKVNERSVNEVIF